MEKSQDEPKLNKNALNFTLLTVDRLIIDASPHSVFRHFFHTGIYREKVVQRMRGHSKRWIN